jgi:hypothetical protein
MRKVILLVIPVLLLCCSGFAQKAVKSKSFGSFTVVADSFNSGFGMWYKLRLVVNKKSFPIRDLAQENGSEFDIRPSPNKRYFVIDNIIKGYEEMDGKKELHENYTCVIVDVQKRRVMHAMQSECSGEWNKANKWVVNDRVVFDPLKK